MQDRSRKLEDLKIDEPCSASWGQMPGTAQKRHCDQCDLHVHNLAAMRRSEAEALLERQESGQRVCVRVEYLPNGECVTAETPQLSRTALGRIAATALALGAGLSACSSPQEEPVEIGDPVQNSTEQVNPDCEGIRETLGRLQLVPTMGEPVLEETDGLEDVSQETLELLGEAHAPVIQGTPAVPAPEEE